MLYEHYINETVEWNSTANTELHDDVPRHSFSTLEPSQLAFIWLATVLGLPANLAVIGISIVQFQRLQGEIAQTCLIFNMALAG